ncbi:hypothetical protein NPIL_197761 [Nephila pilipes]|uniref:Methyltransferase domain-containing protein n=1 Tax=Nephila pilipes TaxID=299642 RepID=A0A8X6UFX4_NEPPI|nr:hypothetical protein NPIL_197761 [Nephila pilipes]
MAPRSGTAKILSSKKKDKDFSYHSAVFLVRQCAAEYGWSDLSQDTVMDVGCGSKLNVCNVILKEFPEVKALIAVEKGPSVFQKLKRIDKRIKCSTINILKRESLHDFEGDVDKVISTDTLNTIFNKKYFFENIYRLLKPGGQAAFLFILDCWYDNFLTALLEIPKFNRLKNGLYSKNMYPKEHRRQYYERMLKEIGFEYVVSKEVNRKNLPPSDEEWKDVLYESYKHVFEIPAESVEEIKEEAYQIYVTKIEKHEKYCHRVLMLILLAKKPF